MPGEAAADIRATEQGPVKVSWTSDRSVSSPGARGIVSLFPTSFLLSESVQFATASVLCL